MRNKILAANWKMNLTQPEVDHWLQVFEDNYWDAIGKELRLYPGSLYIQKLASAAHVGAQNFYFESKGAFTGEISLAQLKSVGAQSVLIGHSERREIFNENAQLVKP
jgi:triosephosphate isomerase